ncbi:hypothetical protein TWF506_002605 [Arthrobotrys conoides]|uniref:Uncharacterized protein n=1 Tax=Arthrobotrys conoides TaxID=74498 RepID=A0AAN8NFA5_9PEZI
MRIGCVSWATVLQHWPGPAPNRAGPGISDLDFRVISRYRTFLIPAPGALARENLGRKIQQQQTRCRACHCDPQTGGILRVPQPQNAFQCASDVAARACEILFRCFCTVRLGQPDPDPGVPMQDYIDALNDIPDSVFNHPINEGWEWIHPLPLQLAHPRPRPPPVGPPAWAQDAPEAIAIAPQDRLDARLEQLYGEDHDTGNLEAFWGSVLEAENLEGLRDRIDSLTRHNNGRGNGGGSRDGILKRDIDDDGGYTDEHENKNGISQLMQEGE